MREPQQKTIEGVAYEVTPLPAGKGLRVATTLARVLGPALGGLAASQAPGAAGLAGAALSDLLADVAARLEPETVEALARTLAEQSRAEVVPGSGNLVPLGPHFDVHFQGRFLALAAWLRFALEVNFQDVFRGLGRSAAPPAASAARAP